MKSYNYMTCSGQRIGFHVQGRVGASGGDAVDQVSQCQMREVHLVLDPGGTGHRRYLLDSVNEQNP